MKQIIIVGLLFLNFAFFSCKTTRQINKAIRPKDSTTVFNNKSAADSLKLITETLQAFKAHTIDFKTFNAKIKVDVEDAKGKQPDITAVVRIIKDSVIWMSLSATFLNIEVYRVLITKDSVILLNKQNKEVQYRSLDYLQEVAEIPVDFKTVQNLLIGNPVFYADSIKSYRQLDNLILITAVGDIFKNLLTLSAADKLLKHIKLDDVNISRNRTADITYDDYEFSNGINFSTYRQIIASEKNKIDIRLNFKQYEFNKQLSVAFNIPKNYKRK
ncbi:MAG: DUF4292 domain-containing protein [Ferruginibacter sp.]